jgi:GAF domain-containing protein
LLRDQLIGALGLREAGAGRRWSDDDIALAQTISEQFALAAENLRLFEETQRRAAREELTGTITARMRETLDLDTVLRTAVDEMYHVLELDEIAIRMFPEETTDQDTPEAGNVTN